MRKPPTEAKYFETSKRQIDLHCDKYVKKDVGAVTMQNTRVPNREKWKKINSRP